MLNGNFLDRFRHFFIRDLNQRFKYRLCCMSFSCRFLDFLQETF